MSRQLERKRQSVFEYHGFGFPVVLSNVPMVQVRGVWTPDVNFNELEKKLLAALACKPVRLTGNEVRFIRHSLSMTLEQFAERFGVTHPAVLKWEAAKNRPTKMTWAVEKDIRLEILSSLSSVRPSRFVEVYEDLNKEPSSKPERVRLVCA